MTEPVLVLPRAAYRRNRARWLAARRQGIGGSDAAAVLGLSPWESPLSLWVDKTRPAGDDQRTEAMRWGTVLEDAIAREMAKEYGIRLGPCPGLLAHPHRPWQLATVDRYVVDRTRRPTAVVEVKTANAFAAGEWAAGGPPPNHVVIQVQHQLDVTGLDVGYVAALVGGNQPRWWALERDEELLGMLRRAEERFWTDHILTGVPPAPTGHDADGAALAALYKGDPGREVVLAAEVLDDLEHLAAAKAEIKDLGRYATSLEQKVKAALGDATEGLRPDGSTAVTWRPVTSRRLNADRLRAQRPDLYEEYLAVSTTRRLLVKTTKEAVDAAA